MNDWLNRRADSAQSAPRRSTMRTLLQAGVIVTLLSLTACTHWRTRYVATSCPAPWTIPASLAQPSEVPEAAENLQRQSVRLQQALIDSPPHAQPATPAEKPY